MFSTSDNRRNIAKIIEKSRDGPNKRSYSISQPLDNSGMSAKKLMIDNPNGKAIVELGRYIRNLDDRLSLPRFSKVQAIGS